jgi:dTDP-4-amino-4,6-dideoxygalactose transaminase
MSKLALFGGTPTRQKPFPSWPVFDSSEEQALLDVLHSGRWWSGTQAYHDSPGGLHPSKVAEFESKFAEYHGAKFGLACASGTAALEVSLKAAGVGPGDEVIVPPYTFLATASAPLLIGAVPVFCDIDPDTFNIDPARLEAAITSRTKAIIPVHFAGLAADIDRILAIARKHNLFVLEDAAHAHGAISGTKHLGTLGDAGVFSFQASKNMTAGEGGIILTDNAEHAEICNSYIWAGRKVGRPWYEHYRLGWNYRLTEFQAAILIAQLGRLREQTTTRMQNGIHLNGLLSQIPGIRTLAVPPSTTMHPFHIYIFRLDSAAFGVERKNFLAALLQEGIPCSGGYSQPLYQNPMFLENKFHSNDQPISSSAGWIDFGSYQELCPNAERACNEAIWIEHRALLGNTEDVEDIAASIRKIYENRHEFRMIAAD